MVHYLVTLSYKPVQTNFTACPQVNGFTTTCASFSESKPEPHHAARHIIRSLGNKYSRPSVYVCMLFSSFRFLLHFHVYNVIYQSQCSSHHLETYTHKCTSNWICTGFNVNDVLLNFFHLLKLQKENDMKIWEIIVTNVLITQWKQGKFLITHVCSSYW